MAFSSPRKPTGRSNALHLSMENRRLKENIEDVEHRLATAEEAAASAERQLEKEQCAFFRDRTCMEDSIIAFQGYVITLEDVVYGESDREGRLMNLRQAREKKYIANDALRDAMKTSVRLRTKLAEATARATGEDEPPILRDPELLKSPEGALEALSPSRSPRIELNVTKPDDVDATGMDVSPSPQKKWDPSDVSDSMYYSPSPRNNTQRNTDTMIDRDPNMGHFGYDMRGPNVALGGTMGGNRSTLLNQAPESPSTGFAKAQEELMQAQMALNSVLGDISYEKTTMVVQERSHELEETQRLRATCQSMTEANTRLTKIVDEMREESESKDMRLSQADKSIGDLEARINELNGELEQTRDEASALKQDLEGVIAKLKVQKMGEGQRLHEEVLSLQDKLSAMQDELFEEQHKRKEGDRMIAVLNEQVANLSVELGAAEERARSLDARLRVTEKDHTAQSEGLEAESERQKKSIALTTSEVDKLRGSLNATMLRLENEGKRCAELQCRNHELEVLRESNNVMINRLSIDLRNLEPQLVKAKEEIQQERSKRVGTERTLREMEAVRTSLVMELEQLNQSNQAYVEQLNLQLEKEQKQSVETEGRLAELTLKDEANTAELEMVKGELRTLRTKLAAADSENGQNALKHEKNQLERALMDMGKRLMELQKQGSEELNRTNNLRRERLTLEQQVDALREKIRGDQKHESLGTFDTDTWYALPVKLSSPSAPPQQPRKPACVGSHTKRKAETTPGQTGKPGDSIMDVDNNELRAPQTGSQTSPNNWGGEDVKPTSATSPCPLRELLNRAVIQRDSTSKVVGEAEDLIFRAINRALAESSKTYQT